MDVTADFVYVRLHGSEELYASGYDDEALDAWAARVAAWAAAARRRDAERAAGATRPRKAGRDVYVYFDNDIKVRAPVDAAALAGPPRRRPGGRLRRGRALTPLGDAPITPAHQDRGRRR